MKINIGSIAAGVIVTLLVLLMLGVASAMIPADFTNGGGRPLNATYFNNLGTEINTINDTVNDGFAFVNTSLAQRSYNIIDYGATPDDETDDSAAIIAAETAAYNAGGGIVYIPAGIFYAQGLPIVNGISYQGANSGASTLKLPSNANTHMFKTSGATAITGGAIRDLELDGSSVANCNGIDFSSASYLYEYYIENNYIHNFNHGYHGSNDDRYAPISNNRFWYNGVGIYIKYNHPNIQVNDIRGNVVGVGGGPYDLQFTGTKFNYNQYGVVGLDGGSVTSCQFSNCIFYKNQYVGLELGNNNMVDTCLFVGNNSADTGILLKGNNNNICDNKFRYDNAKFGVASIYFADDVGCTNNQINNNFFGCEGDVIKSGNSSIAVGRNYNAIQNNKFVMSGASHAIVFPDTRGGSEFSYFSITGNTIYASVGIGTDSLIYIPSALYGGQFSNNNIIIVSGSTLGYAASIDARSAIVSENKIKRSLGIQNLSTDGNTIYVNNMYLA